MKRHVMFLAALAALLTVNYASANVSGFVSVDSTHFVLNSQSYFYVGTNYWYGFNLASTGESGDRERLHRELDALRDLGIRNLRIMAGSEGPDTEPWRMVPSLQIAPGIYNFELLDGLDYLLAAMNQRGLRAVMCLSNFWPWSGGLAQYVSWNGGGGIPYPPPEPGGDWNTYAWYTDDFYSNTEAQQDYRDHFDFLALRINSYAGIPYRDDPAIMAWELANEPRGYQNTAAFNQWIDQVAAHIRSVDSNHLITTGCEGNTPWPDWNGLDFAANHDGPDIDYTTMHIWPQNWGWYDPADPEGTYSTAEANARSYLNDHATASALLGKPMVLEEFGLARDGGSFDPTSTTAWRDTFLGAMYDEVYASAYDGGPLGGDNFWSWAGEGRPEEPFGGYWSPGDPWIGDPPHEHQGWYSVYDNDLGTLSVIADHAAAMRGLMPLTGIDDAAPAGDNRQGYLEILPSPATDFVTIRGRLPAQASAACLEVFDLSGRRLSLDRCSSSTFSLLWPGPGHVGTGLSSGTYLARLSWGGVSKTVKFTFIK